MKHADAQSIGEMLGLYDAVADTGPAVDPSNGRPNKSNRLKALVSLNTLEGRVVAVRDPIPSDPNACLVLEMVAGDRLADVRLTRGEAASLIHLLTDALK